MTESEDLWTSILTSCAETTSITDKTLLILGEDGSGKSSIVHRLSGRSAGFRSRACGLEYSYISVQDEDSDETSRIQVWILDGDLAHFELLRFAVNSKSIDKMLAVVMVDMSRPWGVMDTLERWAKVLEDHIEGLKMPPKIIKELEERNIKSFQEYKDPKETATSLSLHTTEKIEGNDILPLTDNVLSHNLGIPVVIVCNKCDLLLSVEEERNYKDEHLDFIQQHVRKFCLKYGATLVYVSAKTGKNCDLLYKFVVHKLCGYVFKEPASLMERDGIFIPTGWDSEKKISVLCEHVKTLKPDNPFQERIVQPDVKKGMHEEEVVAEDDTLFLMRLYQLQESLNQSPVPQQHLATPTGPTTKAGPPKPPDTWSSPGSEAVLTTFFSTLLQKKSGTGAPSAGKTSDKSLSADAVEALQAMQHRGRKQPSANKSRKL